MADNRSVQSKKYDHTLRDFGGVNTQAARQAIEDNEFAWLENIQPIGHGNLRSVGSPVDVGITLAATCYWMKEANLNGADYMLMFCTNGAAYQVALSGYAVTTIGAAATFNGSGTSFDNWSNQYAIIADPTKGIFRWDGTTLVNMSSAFAITASISTTTLTVTVTAGTITVGTVVTGAGVSANTIVTGFIGGTGGTGTYLVNNSQSVGSEAMTATPTVPATGTSIATYSGRVWIASGRTVSYSAPNTYSDFTTTDYGGFFVVQDSTLHSTIQALISTGGFLYLIGTDSVNVISDVRVGGTVPATLFSNLNLVTTAGTVSPSSVIPYFRTLWMASPYGFMAITGANAQKGSDKLDGTYQLLANYTGISGGVVVINQILCLAFLVSYKDPVNGTRPVFLIYFNKKWFVASQVSTLAFAATASLSGQQTMFATDGTKLYKCFSGTSTIAQTVQTKLWDFGEKTISDTQVLKAGVEVVMTNVTGNVNVTVDSEISSQTAALTSTNTVTWVNNTGTTVQWTNNSSNVVNWIASGYTWFRGDVSNRGKYAGMTITTVVPGIELSAAQLQYELRARW